MQVAICGNQEAEIETVINLSVRDFGEVFAVCDELRLGTYVLKSGTGSVGVVVDVVNLNPDETVEWIGQLATRCVTEIERCKRFKADIEVYNSAPGKTRVPTDVFADAEGWKCLDGLVGLLFGEDASTRAAQWFSEPAKISDVDFESLKKLANREVPISEEAHIEINTRAGSKTFDTAVKAADYIGRLTFATSITVSVPKGVLPDGLSIVGATVFSECDRMFKTIESPFAKVRKGLLSTCTKFIGVANAGVFNVAGEFVRREIDAIGRCATIPFDMFVLSNAFYGHLAISAKVEETFRSKSGLKFNDCVLLEAND